MDQKRQHGALGFTLIEMMIAVVIIGILAAVAVFAYVKHIKSARLVEAQAFASDIQAHQETYFQRFGYYCNASGAPNTYYPQLGNSHCVGGDSNEPCPKEWNTLTYQAPTGFRTLGVRPESGRTYFEWLVIASNPNGSPPHDIGGDPNPARGGINIPDQPSPPDPPHPWYYIIGRADLNSSGIPCGWSTCTHLVGSSARGHITILQQGN